MTASPASTRPPIARQKAALPGLEIHLPDHGLPRRARGDHFPKRLDARPLPGPHGLDDDLNLPSAGEPDLEGGVVGNPETQTAAGAVFKRIDRLEDDRALDTAARDRSLEALVLGDDELGADRAGRGAPGLHHRRQRDAAACLDPSERRFRDFVMRFQRDNSQAPMTVPQTERESTLE